MRRFQIWSFFLIICVTELAAAILTTNDKKQIDDLITEIINKVEVNDRDDKICFQHFPHTDNFAHTLLSNPLFSLSDKAMSDVSQIIKRHTRQKQIKESSEKRYLTSNIFYTQVIKHLKFIRGRKTIPKLVIEFHIYECGLVLWNIYGSFETCSHVQRLSNMYIQRLCNMFDVRKTVGRLQLYDYIII